MLNRTKLVAVLAITAVSAACEREATETVLPGEVAYAAIDSTFSSNPNRRFDQIERLGNPLVMEVFVQKREHSAYDAFPVAQDPGHFTDDIVHFVMTVAGRDQGYAEVIASVLVGTPQKPGDMIHVFPRRQAGATASNMTANAGVGWLTHVLAPGQGYGGRKVMGDDTVDKGTAVVFGSAAGNTNNVSPGLVGDNVNANDQPMLNAFPWLPAPTGVSGSGSGS
jgi:hypothetical protein